MARELSGSSSNLYSVSGSSTHSLVLNLPESPADMETKCHADKECGCFVMNFGCYALGDASNGTEDVQRVGRVADPGNCRGTARDRTLLLYLREKHLSLKDSKPFLCLLST